MARISLGEVSGFEGWAWVEWVKARKNVRRVARKEK